MGPMPAAPAGLRVDSSRMEAAVAAAACDSLVTNPLTAGLRDTPLAAAETSTVLWCACGCRDECAAQAAQYGRFILHTKLWYGMLFVV